MEEGIRVVRGTDWESDSQDGGEGHCGTVIEIPKEGDKVSEQTVVVLWDSGFKYSYRAGRNQKYDLKMINNATTGIVHPNVICDHCKQLGIQGMRWNCTTCVDFDLCTTCYMRGRHYLGHEFMRYDTNTSQGVLLPPRSESLRVMSKGIFKNAIVVRGQDWNWPDHDGGVGKTGRVIDIRDWDVESGLSVACVQWAIGGPPYIYRVGHMGKVDLKYIQESNGGYYYKDHLPSVGRQDEALIAAFNNVSLTTRDKFSVGDKVKVNVALSLFKEMQGQHGGWNQKMDCLVDKIGIVHRITDKGDVRVQYEGADNRWTISPNALVKVMNFAVGDYVRINYSEDVVRNLQTNHGGWFHDLKAVLNKVCLVNMVYNDGDLRINHNGMDFKVNPLCCSNVPKHQADKQNTVEYHDMKVVASAPERKSKEFISEDENLPVNGGHEQLVREARDGNFKIVKELLAKTPNIIDQEHRGRTALQVAAHQGHVDIFKHLLHLKANVDVQDIEGDTPLHFASYGNQSEFIELLLEKNANINSLNMNGCSPLHVAVNKQHPQCVKVLLKNKCDCNVQDSFGDTALHDIIGKELNDKSKQIIDLLLLHPTINLALKNKRGFNTLHHACLKGNAYAAERIIKRSPQLIEIRKHDGFSPFHLAALNGHKQVIKCLLDNKADKEILNKRRQTPLFLATSQLHTAVTELLVENGADVNAYDEDGDTCLHMTINDKFTASSDSNLLEECSPPDLGESSLISVIAQNMPDQYKYIPSFIIASYLIQNGANLNKKNKKNKKPLDYIDDEVLKEFLYKQFFTIQSAKVKEVKPMKCKLCDEEALLVTLKPCHHKIVCFECSIRLKRCIECNGIVHSKESADGKLINLNKTDVAELINKLRDIEDAQTCAICMEFRRDTAFECGHTACNICAEALRECHICRQIIMKKIRMYI